ncbi:unnamed protein product [Caenorhabditis bovis]|uniref:RNA helicase n=1 Tax=Caenorhabditis bovis TaxID=2654633 RepID=A0A8S1F1D6_9PELO|nr:unnamed protein product [Caenorhabditis bovis]
MKIKHKFAMWKMKKLNGERPRQIVKNQPTLIGGPNDNGTKRSAVDERISTTVEKSIQTNSEGESTKTKKKRRRKRKKRDRGEQFADAEMISKKLEQQHQQKRMNGEMKPMMLNGKRRESEPATPLKREKFTRGQLPIDLVEHQIMLELARNETLIIVGETGSGKSTQIPQMCCRVPVCATRAIGVTQPRRVAAVSLANRVAIEMATNVGKTVGYHVRFENVTGPETKIEYMTDGVVLRKSLMSPLLEHYSTIIIDEAHERSLHTDVLMCILRQCQVQRRGTENPLRLIIMSATLQAQKFCEYFNNAKAILVKGRTFPIEMYYSIAKSSSDYVYNAIVAIKSVHLSEPSGHDVLVFLTGSEEIEAVANRLHEMNASLPPTCDVIMPVPLYAALRPDQQKLAFRPAPKGTRKVILSTNIAETSVTIPGVRVVIDSGKVKTKRFNAIDRVDILKVHNVSKAQARQRAGRAGRDAPGKCYRLFAKSEFDEFDDDNMPEIQRSNLASTFLELMKLGMKNPHRLRLIHPPDAANIDAALIELVSLSAIRPLNSDYSKFALTDTGELYCKYPLPPDHSRVLIQAQKHDCMMEAIKIIAAMQTESIWCAATPTQKTDDEYERIRRRYETKEGDHVTMLKLILASNQFFDELNKKTMRDSRFANSDVALQREYHAAIRQFCDDNMINEQHLKTASLIEEQLVEIARESRVAFSTCGADFGRLRKALALGLFMNSCEYDRQEDRYRLMINPAITVQIHPSSCLARSKPSCIVFSQLMRTTDLYAMQVTLIDADWVRPLISAYKKLRSARGEATPPTTSNAAKRVKHC